MFYKIKRGWYGYNTNGIVFHPMKNVTENLVGCKTCLSNNYDDSIICLDCRRAHR